MRERVEKYNGASFKEHLTKYVSFVKSVENKDSETEKTDTKEKCNKRSKDLAEFIYEGEKLNLHIEKLDKYLNEEFDKSVKQAQGDSLNTDTFNKSIEEVIAIECQQIIRKFVEDDIQISSILDKTPAYKAKEIDDIRAFFLQNEDSNLRNSFEKYVSDPNYLLMCFNESESKIPVKGAVSLYVKTVDLGPGSNNLDIIPITQVPIVFRPIYQMKLSSVPSLIEYFSSQKDTDDAGNVNNQNSHLSPVLLYQLCRCITGKECNLIDGLYNPLVFKLISDRQADINKIFESNPDKGKGLQAKGLFQLVLAHALRLFLFIHDDRTNAKATEFYKKMYLPDGQKVQRDLLNIDSRDLALINHRSYYSKVYEKMNGDDKELFAKAVEAFCKNDAESDLKIEYCDIIQLYLFTKDRSKSSWGDQKQTTLKEWIDSIKTPSTLYQKIKIHIGPHDTDTNTMAFHGRIAASDFLLLPNHVRSPETPNVLNNTDPISGDMLHEVYPMGDYDDFEDGHVVLELSAFSFLDFKASHIQTDILNVITSIEKELIRFDAGEVYVPESSTENIGGVELI